jgi:hypothetical protein
LARIDFHTPRVGLDSLVVLSIHLNNIIAKKPCAPVQALEEVFEKTIGHGSFDIVCGDINMARWGKDCGGEWRADVLSLLKKWDIEPVSYFPDECCFIGVNSAFARRFIVKGSCWGEQERNKGDSGWDRFAEQVGCKKSSKDVHWPLTLAIRMKGTATGFRKRSAAGIEARKKASLVRHYSFPCPLENKAAHTKNDPASRSGCVIRYSLAVF